MGDKAGLWDGWGLPGATRTPEGRGLCSKNLLQLHCDREAMIIEQTQFTHWACLSNAQPAAPKCSLVRVGYALMWAVYAQGFNTSCIGTPLVWFLPQKLASHVEHEGFRGCYLM
jgi:hypothetical protein